MAEYISRETMIKLLQSMADNAEASGFSYDREVIESVMATLAGIPAADVAPVVRCKDCKLRKTEDCAMYCECECGYQFSWETDNGFCSWGQRKE